MALGMWPTMAFVLLLFSLVVVSHCDAVEADSATNDASSSYIAIVPAKVQAALEDAEGLLRLPSSFAEPDPDRSLVEPVAEPDPDRSIPDSDELATNKPCREGQQGYEKVKKEQIDDEDKDEAEEEKGKADRKKEGKKRTKKHHDSDDKGKKEKVKKHHHRQRDDEDKEEEDSKKRIHRQHRGEESAKTKNKLSRHIKNNDDSDDEEEEEKKAKRWRKAIKSRFGHGRRSQREEAEKAKVI